MVDDRGESNIDVIERLLPTLGLKSQLHVITRSEDLTESHEWRSSGPHLDSLPATNLSIARVARDNGATVVLTGNGADELLASTRYLAGALVRQLDIRALRQYLADTVGVTSKAIPWEMFGMISPFLPRRLRAWLFVAGAWAELYESRSPSILVPQLRGEAERWSARFLDSIRTVHLAHPCWSVMDAWDAMFPAPDLPQPGLLPWVNPFREPEFVQAAQRLPMVGRYDALATTPYWRAKRQVLDLIPARLHCHLPSAKATFAGELRGHHLSMPREAPSCARVGLVDPAALLSCNDPMVLSRTAAVEQWLAEAVRQGHTIGP
ncbi:MAG: hypothetical protein QOJ29_2246 [Thermoleophilaceae bacterium]|jgi:asparagine synthase (glutamine-hydrolysing)|nr:hypothetical protein [Thermoleophilaceae bacterium]